MQITPSLSFIQDLDPLIVTSPTVRCGTTLLQRLLCSARNTLIYGENCGYELEFFLNTYAAKAPLLRMHQGRLDAVLQSVLRGDVNDMIIDLMPDVEGQLRALEESCFKLFAYYREYACKVGRPIWGIKFPCLSIGTLNLLRAMVPRSRVIFIHRHLGDCLQSAKAWQGLSLEGEIRQFCTVWLQNMNFILGRSEDRVILRLEYQDLVTQPTQMIELLASFSGAESIDTQVLDKKINTWVHSDPNNPSVSGYIQPIPLTEWEKRIVEETIAGLVVPIYS